MSLAIIVMNFTLYRMFNACDRRNKLRFPEDERNSFKSNSLKSLFKSHLAIGGGFNLLQYLHAVAIPYEAPAPRTAPNSRDKKKENYNYLKETTFTQFYLYNGNKKIMNSSNDTCTIASRCGRAHRLRF